MPRKQIVQTKISALKPFERNARTHSGSQVDQIARSIETFGFTNPVLIDKHKTIIAGHGRVEAAKQLGLLEVPTLTLQGLSPEKVRAYVIADNKLAENAGWDSDLLALEIQELDELDLDFDLEVIGFETPELDMMLGHIDSETPSDADEFFEHNTGPIVTRPGDLWHIGPHRLLCGDALKHESYATLLGQHKAQMVFTDPPYNVPVNGHVCGLGRVKHAEFAMASGEMSVNEFRTFLSTVTEHLSAFSKNGAIHYLCMDWRHIQDLLIAAGPHYSELKNLCVWNKANGGMGSLYRSKHELVAVYKVGTRPHINNVALGKHGRNRTNVWDYAGINSISEERSKELAMHPTVKPVALVKDAILDCSKRGGLILDVFAGSGTSLLAAELTGRVGYGLEIGPGYVDTALKRLEEKSGLTARLGAHGPTFTEVKRKRVGEERETAA